MFCSEGPHLIVVACLRNTLYKTRSFGLPYPHLGDMKWHPKTGQVVKL